MRTAESPIGFRGTDAVDTSDHEDGHAALHNSSHEGGQSLGYEDGARGDVQIMA